MARPEVRLLKASNLFTKSLCNPLTKRLSYLDRNAGTKRDRPMGNCCALSHLSVSGISTLVSIGPFQCLETFSLKVPLSTNYAPESTTRFSTF